MKITKFFLCLIALSSFIYSAIDINVATKEELMKLNGIGKAKAEAIIEYRNTHKFQNIDELKNVNGIGSKIFDNIKKDIYVDNKTERTNLEEDIKTNKGKNK